MAFYSHNPKKKKRRFNKKIFLLTSIILAMTAGATTAIGFGINELRYIFRPGMNLVGGYQSYFVNYDFYQPSTSLDDKPNGDAELTLPLIKNKLDPLHQTHFEYSLIGKYGAVVRAPLSNFDKIEELNDKINASGQLLLLDEQGNDLLISEGEAGDAVPFKRKKFSDYLGNNVQATINKKTNEPVVQIAVGSKWSELTKNVKDIYLWHSVGSFIDKIRNDWKNQQRFVGIYKILIEQLKKINDKYSSSFKANVKKIFQYTSKTKVEGIKRGNMLDDYNTLSSTKQEVFKNIKWTIPAEQLFVNTFNDNITEKEASLIALEPVINRIYNSKIFMDDEGYERYNPFLLNLKNIDDHKSLKDAENGVINILNTTASEAVIKTSLIQNGLSHQVFRVISYNKFSPNFKKTLFISAVIMVAISIFAFFLYLISYFRAMGALCFLGFIFALISTLFLTSFLGITFGLVSVLALLLINSTVMTLVYLILQSYREEVLKNKLPAKSAFKLTFLRELPKLCGIFVVFLLVILGFYWLGKGIVKELVVFSLINLVTSIVGGLLLPLFMIWLLLLSGWLVKHNYLNVQQDNLIPFVKKKSQQLQQKFQDYRKNKQEQQGISHQKLTLPTITDADSVPTEKSGGASVFFTKRKIFLTFSAVFTIVFLIISGGLLIGKKVNLDRSLNRGAVYFFDNLGWKRENRLPISPQAEIDLIKELASGDDGWDLKRYHTRFEVGSVNWKNKKTITSLIITTNIQDKKTVNRFQRWLLKASFIPNPLLGLDHINWEFYYPDDNRNLYLKAVFGLLLAVLLVLFFTILFYDWTQGMMMFAIATATIGQLVFFIVGMHFLISIQLLAILVALWEFTMVISGLVGMKIRRNRKFIDNHEQDLLLKKYHDYCEKRRIYKLIARKNGIWTYWRTYRFMKLSYPQDGHKKVLYETKKYWLLVDALQIHNQAMQSLKFHKNKFSQEKKAHNYLYPIAIKSIKDVFWQFFILMGLLVFCLMIFAILTSGSSFLFWTFLIGVILVFYNSLIIGTYLWVWLNLRRDLRKALFRQRMLQFKPKLDEHIVSGINDYSK